MFGIAVTTMVVVWKKSKSRKITFSCGWFNLNMCLVKTMVEVDV
jgi:hypothetical protein